MSSSSSAEQGLVRLQALAKGWLTRKSVKSEAQPGSEANSEQLTSPFVPSSYDAVDQFLDLAEVHDSDVVCDLGSGDGRVLIASASKRKARCIGVECDAKFIEQAQINLKAAGEPAQSLVKFVHCGVESPQVQELLPGVSVVFVFMLPKVITFLRKLLLAYLPLGARVVSYTFRFGDADWPADKVVPVKSPMTSLFLYTITEQARRRFASVPH